MFLRLSNFLMKTVAQDRLLDYGVNVCFIFLSKRRGYGEERAKIIHITILIYI
jgi:hypothetical protein